MLYAIFATKMCIMFKQEFCENADIITRSAQVFRVLKISGLDAMRRLLLGIKFEIMNIIDILTSSQPIIRALPLIIH
jgi:hypothetical protein